MASTSKRAYTPDRLTGLDPTRRRGGGVTPPEGSAVAAAKPHTPGWWRMCLWLGITAPLLFTAVFTIDGALQPGYSAYNEAISYLDLGAQGWIQRANFIAFGALLLAFALGYLATTRPILPGRWLGAVATCLFLSDLGWMLAGVFVPDPYLAPQVSMHAVLHQVASIVVFLPFAAASLLQGVRLIATRGWRAYGGYCLLLGLIQAFFPLATTVYFFHPSIVRNVNSPGSGLFNRVALLLGPISWYVLLGCVLSVRERMPRRRGAGVS